MLNFLYNNPLGKSIRPLFTNHTAGKIISCLYNSSLSRYFIPSFVKKYNINMSDYKTPIDKYKTFNEFFCRELKSEARPIDTSPNTIISPADGKILAVTNISESTKFFVKDSPFLLSEFLQDDSLASQYLNGTLIIIRLSPWNYHRFHFPLDCTPSTPFVIKKKLESVNPIAYKSGLQPLLLNTRHIITLSTDMCKNVLMIPVGALFVGSIKETYTPFKNFKKGDEAGYFALGGSSIVLLFEKNIIKLTDSISIQERNIKMGEPICSWTIKK
jgi:phosphatidylserine decarboxylase